MVWICNLSSSLEYNESFKFDDRFFFISIQWFDPPTRFSNNCFFGKLSHFWRSQPFIWKFSYSIIKHVPSTSASQIFSTSILKFDVNAHNNFSWWMRDWAFIRTFTGDYVRFYFHITPVIIAYVAFKKPVITRFNLPFSPKLIDWSSY